MWNHRTNAMRRSRLWALGLLSAAGLAAAVYGGLVGVGAPLAGCQLRPLAQAETLPVRNVVLQDDASQKVALRDMIREGGDGGVVINFWATWCPPCVQELPTLMRMAQQWRDQGVAMRVVLVSEDLDPIEDVRAFLDAHGITLPSYHDRGLQVAKAFKVEPLPTTVVVNRRGEVVLRHAGVCPWDDAPFMAEIAALALV